MPNPEIPPLDPHVFEPIKEGDGDFGHWALDDANLPCYHYTMNQLNNPYAYYVNSEGIERRDHWHQIGNKRVTGLASNDGVVQLYLADRGGIFLNRFGAYTIEPPRTLKELFFALVRFIVRLYGRLLAAWIKFRMRDVKAPRGATLEQTAVPKSDLDDDPMNFAFSGGFGYLDDGEKTWATAFRYGPSDGETRRVFGMGYYETEMTYRNIRHTRRVYAPHGSDQTHDYSDDPLLLIDLEIENKSDKAVELRHYEYWDVNMHQMQVQWLRTGIAAAFGNRNRFLINQRFLPNVQWLPDENALRFSQASRSAQRLPDEISGEVDPAPPDVFLASLSATPDAYYVDQDEFFGMGDARLPDAVRDRAPGEREIRQQPSPMSNCMVLRHNLHLEPGAVVRLRFAYGAVLKPGTPLEVLKYYRDGDWFTRSRDTWRDQAVYFSNGSTPVFQREATWHSYNLLSSMLYSEYYRTHYLPQGSTYLYLHGADGVPRDQSLFTLASVYMNPALARETLRLLMGLQRADTLALPYGFGGNGFQSDALGLHSAPSDLDLFFMWAIAEYLSATGDVDFLSVEVPFYPRDSRPTKVPGLTVLDHIRAAFLHLTTAVGVGEHGLLRIGTGDWDDGVVIQTVLNTSGRINRDNSVARGETVPNSQMALYVLPLIAALIQKRDPYVARQMIDLADELKLAVKRQWNYSSRWYYRALLRDLLNGVEVLGDNHVNLQSQPWALISGLAREMQVEEALITTLTQTLDIDDSPTGAMIAEKDLIWPAVSQLLTWGYMRSQPALAWRSLQRHTFAAHATAFPRVWFNIWSGPDATNSKLAPANPGGTWSSPVTPMTDFPVANNNQPAMWLLALLRVCGIEPSTNGDGLMIAPKPPGDRFVLDTKLLALDVAPGRIAGEYRAWANGSRVLHVPLPDGAVNVVTTVNGAPQDAPSPDSREVRLLLTFKSGDRIPFEVRWG